MSTKDKITEQDIHIQYGNRSSYLNMSAVLAQNLDRETVLKLRDTHIEKLKVFEKMENTDDRKELQELAGQVEAIEYILQELWGFKPSKFMHEWYLVPKCTCLKGENQKRRGTVHERYIDHFCLVHGDL